MADPLSQKTFRLEIIFTVSMDEVSECHMPESSPESQLSWLRNLQRKLLNDEPALIRQMLVNGIQQLHAYISQLSEQNGLHSLQATAVQGEDSDEIEAMSGDFFNQTRPLRVNSFNTDVAGVVIRELVQRDDRRGWRAVWSDLWGKSLFGKVIARVTGGRRGTNQTSGHYLQVRGVNRQLDGVHFEGYCSCGLDIEAAGPEEEQALQAIWEQFQRHVEKVNLGSRIEREMRNVVQGEPIDSVN